jgi:uncharacterized protein with PIN domain
MIVVDSSALIAILEKEPDAAIYAAASRSAVDFSGQRSRIRHSLTRPSRHGRRRAHVAVSQGRKRF